jgi:integrase
MAESEGSPEPAKVRGVYEHPKGSRIWWCQYFADGKRRRERVGTKSNAIKLYQKRKTQILVGEKLPELQRRKATFGELLDLAVAYAEEHNKTATQYAQKAAMLRPAFGARAAEDIKPEELSAWIRERGISGSSFNRYRAFLSLCYREGIRSKLVQANTARLIPQKREPKGRERFLSREEYEAILKVIRERCPHREPDFVISVHTGMRLSEQYGLEWRQVDLEQKKLRLFDTKNGENRTIRLNSVVVEQLTGIAPKKRAGSVFPRPRGGATRLKPRWFEAVLEEAGVAGYTWHCNRHTFCSWLAMAGVQLRTIKDLAGHKSLAMTMRYAHLSPEHTQSEVEKLVLPEGPRVVSIRSATRTASG